MAQTTGISISHEARDELRRFQAKAIGTVQARLNMSDTVRLAVALAEQHLSAEGAAAWRALTTDPNGAEQ